MYAEGMYAACVTMFWIAVSIVFSLGLVVGWIFWG